MEHEFVIQRRTMIRKDFCFPGSAESVVIAMGVNDYRQKDMIRFISKKRWGTQPKEAVRIFTEVIPEGHVLARQHLTFNQLQEIFSGCKRVCIVIDGTDKLNRYDERKKKKVPKGKIDGHYTVVAGIVERDGYRYAVCVDSSKDEIVQEDEKRGVIVLSKNIYLVREDFFKEMWHDKNIDGSPNDQWGCIVIHPNDNPEILNKYRVE